ncbi:hypothetical protein HDU82_001043 [Entophlyctis luteolus]|nr:hypothetical protein HDU82_001043 [Entophlyctis luteolus]
MQYKTPLDVIRNLSTRQPHRNSVVSDDGGFSRRSMSMSSSSFFSAASTVSDRAATPRASHNRHSKIRSFMLSVSSILPLRGAQRTFRPAENNSRSSGIHFSFGRKRFSTTDNTTIASADTERSRTRQMADQETQTDPELLQPTEPSGPETVELPFCYEEATELLSGISEQTLEGPTPSTTSTAESDKIDADFLITNDDIPSELVTDRAHTSTEFPNGTFTSETPKGVNSVPVASESFKVKLDRSAERQIPETVSGSLLEAKLSADDIDIDSRGDFTVEKVSQSPSSGEPIHTTVIDESFPQNISNGDTATLTSPGNSELTLASATTGTSSLSTTASSLQPPLSIAESDVGLQTSDVKRVENTQSPVLNEIPLVEGSLDLHSFISDLKKQGCGLLVLDLSDTEVSREIVAKIAKTLKSNKTLRKLAPKEFFVFYAALTELDK